MFDVTTSLNFDYSPQDTLSFPRAFESIRTSTLLLSNAGESEPGQFPDGQPAEVLSLTLTSAATKLLVHFNASPFLESLNTTVEDQPFAQLLIEVDGVVPDFCCTLVSLYSALPANAQGMGTTVALHRILEVEPGTHTIRILAGVSGSAPQAALSFFCEAPGGVACSMSVMEVR
jgi:hypothetical protein